MMTVGGAQSCKVPSLSLESKNTSFLSLTAGVPQSWSGRSTFKESFIGHLVLAFACLCMPSNDNQFILNGVAKYYPIGNGCMGGIHARY